MIKMLIVLVRIHLFYFYGHVYFQLCVEVHYDNSRLVLLFSVSISIPVVCTLVLILTSSNLLEVLSDISGQSVVFAGSGVDFLFSGTAASWSFFSLLLLATLAILFAFSTYLDFDDCHFEFQVKLISFFFAVWALLLTGIGFPSLLCWELVGWISFRLISHWLSRSAASKQGLLALNANRVGDVAFLVWLSLGLCSSSSFSSGFVMLDFLFLGCMLAKSVVALTFLWLPEAMEGPTPVSALLHSCTLVMAGLFTYFRIKAHMTIPFLFLAIISLICLSLSAFEPDIKRIVAYSTVSLVSFLWAIICFLSDHSSTAIALLHAGYKSALFVSLGRLISNSEHASLTSFDSKSVISLFSLLLLIAFAPLGSSYVALKHAALAVDVSASIFGTVGIAISCVAPIIAWIATFRVYPSFYGISKLRSFAPSVHDWFVLKLYAGFWLLCFVVDVPGSVLFDANANLSFIVVLIFVTKLVNWLSDKIIGKLVVMPLDLPNGVFAFIYLPFAFLNSWIWVSSNRIKISSTCLALSGICFAQLFALGT